MLDVRLSYIIADNANRWRTELPIRRVSDMGLRSEFAVGELKSDH